MTNVHSLVAVVTRSPENTLLKSNGLYVQTVDLDANIDLLNSQIRGRTWSVVLLDAISMEELRTRYAELYTTLWLGMVSLDAQFVELGRVGVPGGTVQKTKNYTSAGVLVDYC